MQLVTHNGADATSAGPSHTIWGDCPVLAMLQDPSIGFHFFDDFLNFGGNATAGESGWSKYIDTSNTILPLATEVGGVVQLLTDATDNDSPILTSGSNTAGCVKVVSGGKAMWYEARVRVSSAALTEAAYFVGLTEEACAANDGLISDNPDTDIATVMADKDYIGFANFTNAAPVLAACYKKAGGTDTVVVASAHTIALGSWVKLGIKFEPTIDRLTFYVNGASVGYFDVGDAGTTNFPSGEELAMTFGLKNGTTAAKLLDVDWVRVAQLR
jgi:hypothetical protein